MLSRYGPDIRSCTLQDHQSVRVEAIVDVADVCCFTCRPDITIEDIQDTDDDIQFYTDLTRYCIYLSLITTLLEFDADKLGTTSS